MIKDNGSVPHLIDATTAAKASAGSAVMAWLAAAFSVESVVYLSFLFGAAAAVFSIVRHIRDEIRANAREQRAQELHQARLDALKAGKPDVPDTDCAPLT